MITSEKPIKSMRQIININELNKENQLKPINNLAKTIANRRKPQKKKQKQTNNVIPNMFLL